MINHNTTEYHQRTTFFRRAKTSTTQLCLLSPFTISPTSEPRKPLREERERKREALWLKTKTLRPTPLEDISSLTELQVTPGSPTVLTSQWKFKIAAKRNTFSPPAGAHQLTWQWRLSRLLQEPLYRFALSQTGDDSIYMLVQIYIQRSEAQFSRKKHPVVPEQYARVIGLGEPIVGSGVLWAFVVHCERCIWGTHQPQALGWCTKRKPKKGDVSATKAPGTSLLMDNAASNRKCFSPKWTKEQKH